jgi:PAS domain S-box-containing protein
LTALQFDISLTLILGANGASGGTEHINAIIKLESSQCHFRVMAESDHSTSAQKEPPLDLIKGLPPDINDRLMAVILDNMFVGVMLATVSDGKIVFANPRFASMFGYGRGELEGQSVVVLNAPTTHTPAEVAGRIIADLERQGFWQGEVENIRKDGTHFWTLAKVTTFEHPRLGPVWVTVQMDITEQRRAEAESRRNEERLNLVLEATGGGAWDWNIQTGEVHLSSYWKTSLGYSVEELPPHVTTWESLLHPEDVPRAKQALEEHLAGRTATYECVTRLRKKDGTWRWNLDRGRVVERSPSGEPLRMVGTDTDLSEQRWSGLREFIPICAGCKMIRDEQGAWHPLEHHFGNRSQVQFSHGLCPNCLRRYEDNSTE